MKGKIGSKAQVNTTACSDGLYSSIVPEDTTVVRNLRVDENVPVWKGRRVHSDRHGWPIGDPGDNYTDPPPIRFHTGLRLMLRRRWSTRC